MPFIAISSIGLLAATGLVVDGGWSFVQSQAAQNGADAGARAAAQQIVAQAYVSAADTGSAVAQANLSAPSTSSSVTISFSSVVGADPNDPSLWTEGPPSSSTRAFRARVSATSSTLFMGALGIASKSMTATSVATVYNTASLSSWDNLFPLAIPVPAIGGYTPGASYYLWGPQAADFASYYGMPSQWKGLINMNNDPGTNTATIASWASTGFPGTINAGDQLLIMNGSAGSNVGSGLQAYILAHPLNDAGGTYAYIRIATFNAYDGVTQKVAINGFQRFKVYYSNVAANAGWGIFVGYLNPEGVPITDSYSAYGPSTIKTTG